MEDIIDYNADKDLLERWLRDQLAKPGAVWSSLNIAVEPADAPVKIGMGPLTPRIEEDGMLENDMKARKSSSVFVRVKWSGDGTASRAEEESLLESTRVLNDASPFFADSLREQKIAHWQLDEDRLGEPCYAGHLFELDALLNLSSQQQRALEG